MRASGEKNFVFKVGNSLDKLSNMLKKNADNSMSSLELKMGAAVNLVFRTATAKRPMVGVLRVGGKSVYVTGMFKRKSYMQSVSNPDALFGVPIQTGGLKSSIQKEVKVSGIRKVTGKVWTDSPFARRIEYGFIGKDSLGRQYHQQPRPFIRPALDSNVEVLKKIFSK